ncbi:MAG: hypothetical protein D6785_16680 [Planctomycetota bacterium]|nr:MAG: hypothetical protein D6785_16680 [Planctomycetota bacterium]
MVPNLDDPRWIPLITGEKKVDFELLATKILFSRFKMRLRLNPSDETIQQCIKEAREYFLENEHLAKKELEKLFPKK